MNEPAVVLTDLGLAVLGGWLGWRLWKVAGERPLPRAGSVLLAGLASAALWGAIFHAFFPQDTATFGGFIAWIPVALSILLVAATLLDLTLRILAPRLGQAVRLALVAIYSIAFVAVVLLVDESFSTIVRFYGPVVVLFLATALWQAIRSASRGWMLIAAAFIFSVGAAMLQQAQVSLHPVYFDYNAVYHVVQAVAVVLLYFGFRAAKSDSEAASGLP
jgi:hypothetical protein